ncbi:MAG TPA: FISUMP domain-containing protein [Williamwhitmania sp.]|nr:FISUMP domain-containing protein [Williamwhitmania sp.]
MKKEVIYAVVIAFLFMEFLSCEKKENITLPSVETASVDGIFNTSARVGGKVTNNGGADISDRGIYWGTATSPEQSGTKQQVGTGLGTFYDTLRGLTAGVKYYVKAYATNSKGTVFGDETFFTTQISMPTVTTSAVDEVTPTSAKLGGVVVDSGGFSVTQRGLYWGTIANPRTNGTKVVIGNGIGEFSQTFTNLDRAITYYAIAFATNIKGTAYGDEINFTTQPEIPTVYTTSVYNINTYSATVGGNVSESGGVEVTERGVYWGTSPNAPTSGTKLVIGNGTGSFSAVLTNLNPGISYYTTAFATNSVGTAYGEEKTFITNGSAPVATTLAPSNLSTTTVTLNGLVNANELSTVVSFEYGTTAAYGSFISAAESPTTGSADTLTAALSGLTSNTTYHYRVKAVNDIGTSYGEDLTFTTVITGLVGSVSDNDGNTYQTIGIGYQQWMTENLKTTTYNDGTLIPLVQADTSWAKLTTPGYCWYNNDSIANIGTYGALYNWYTVNTSKLCPLGWHVPSNDEISSLVSYLGGGSMAGGLLKEAGLAHWNSPNTGASNRHGFNARGGGMRLDDGRFDFVKVEGDWWSSTEYSTLNGSYLYMLFNYSNTFQGFANKKYGKSVRCVQDN